MNSQLEAIEKLDPKDEILFWSVFDSRHLLDLHTAINNSSPKTQPKASENYLNTFMVLPDPAYEPYFRRYLSRPTASDGVANILAAVNARQFASDTQQDEMLFVLALPLASFMVWGQDSFGDNGKACIDVGWREMLHL